MEYTSNDSTQPNPPRRRRKRTMWQNFKEAYLPVIIVAVVVVLIISFIVGSVARANEDRNESTEPSGQTNQDQAALLQQEADTLMAQAAKLAATFDYAGAIDALNSFSGDLSAISGMKEKYDEYCDSYARLIPYTDVANIPHLSFNTLMADVTLAQKHGEKGDLYSRNHVTTDEFSAILQKLYDGGYILVSVHDLAQKVTAEDGTVTMTAGKLYLPEGRKPITLTLTDANYDTDMASAGSGFASRLIVDVSGCLANEMINQDGTTVTGSFDFIPILSDFVREHPDFSYHGAKATIAVAGHDGIFGYATASEAASVIETVKADGYDFACYTYDNLEYGNLTAPEIKADLLLWAAQIAPALGEVDILMYPYGSDFTEDTSYTGEAYQEIKSNGLYYLIGTDTATAAWGDINESFMLQTRRWVNGTNLAYRGERFQDLFDASAVIASLRTTVPQ